MFDNAGPVAFMHAGASAATYHQGIMDVARFDFSRLKIPK